MPKIHPTATVDPSARLAEDVQIGPGCIIEPDVQIGPGCVLKENVIIRRYTSIGAGNLIDAFCVLGGLPQDFDFDPESVTYVKIGESNVFRENVTISRATGEGKSTIVGNNTYWMVGAHIGHNAEVRDRAILVNGAAVAGHATIGRGAILSSHVVVHQFCWVGDLVMTQGNSGFSCHLPPYTIGADINCVAGLNTIGLRRAEHISAEDRRQIREAFDITYRRGLPPPKALEKMDECADWGQAADLFREFIRSIVTAEKPHNRPLCRLRRKTPG